MESNRTSVFMENPPRRAYAAPWACASTLGAQVIVAAVLARPWGQRVPPALQTALPEACALDVHFTSPSPVGAGLVPAQSWATTRVAPTTSAQCQAMRLAVYLRNRHLGPPWGAPLPPLRPLSSTSQSRAAPRYALLRAAPADCSGVLPVPAQTAVYSFFHPCCHGCQAL